MSKFCQNHLCQYCATLAVISQTEIVRCPRHTIQFQRYGYIEYIRKIFGLLGIGPGDMESRKNKCESWTLYHKAGVIDRQAKNPVCRPINQLSHLDKGGGEPIKC